MASEDKTQEEQAPVVENELDRVEAWRFHVLTDAGYSHDIAQVLAACLDVDLHQAEDMLKKGCKPSTALCILL